MAIEEVIIMRICDTRRYRQQQLNICIYNEWHQVKTKKKLEGGYYFYICGGYSCSSSSILIIPLLFISHGLFVCVVHLFPGRSRHKSLRIFLIQLFELHPVVVKNSFLILTGSTQYKRKKDLLQHTLLFNTSTQSTYVQQRYIIFLIS